MQHFNEKYTEVHFNFNVAEDFFPLIFLLQLFD